MASSAFPARRSALCTALLIALAPAALAQAPSSFAEPAARMLNAPQGQALARTPAGADPAAAVADALRGQGRRDAGLAALVQLGARTTAAGITHVRLAQQAGGLAVYGSEAKAAFDAQGRLLHVADKLAELADLRVQPAAIGERQALDAAMARVLPGVKAAFSAGARSGNTQAFHGGGFFQGDVEVTRVAVPQRDGHLAEGFVVQTWTARGNQLRRTLVGGDGAVLAVEQRTQNDSYNVFTESPLAGAQAVVPGPGAGNAQSPAGWLGGAAKTTVNISGNNTSTYLDTDANNAADSGGTAVADGNFLAAADLSVSPSTTGNKAVAVQNLFYLVNVAHDTLYRHGFDEAAGNFQVDNFGRGGAGNDPVNAEAQDGSGTDNANFATPADGSRPRMQMYLWSSTAAAQEVVVGGSSYGAWGAAFGPALTTTGVSGSLTLALDAGGASNRDGCEAITTALTNRIALLDRGTCNFTVKVYNAQRAGAKGVIVINNSADAPFAMGGSDPRIRIPSAMVSQADGNTLRGLAGSSGTLRRKAVAPPMIDGDLDADVVFHEYGHGLTWRMIGGMSGPLAGAVGEGASDVVAFLMNGDDRIGEYAAGNPLGIRSAPYEGYGRTYASVTGGEVHSDGEVYAAALWKVRTAWLAGRSLDSLFHTFVDGMNYTPATPAFEHMRNGMLASIGNDATLDAGEKAARCQIVWQGFAAQGVGVGASGVVSGNGTVTITPSFTAGTGCSF